jgi:hypothetical protein
MDARLKKEQQTLMKSVTDDNYKDVYTEIINIFDTRFNNEPYKENKDILKMKKQRFREMIGQSMEKKDFDFGFMPPKKGGNVPCHVPEFDINQFADTLTNQPEFDDVRSSLIQAIEGDDVTSPSLVFDPSDELMETSEVEELMDYQERAEYEDSSPGDWLVDEIVEPITPSQLYEPQLIQLVTTIQTELTRDVIDTSFLTRCLARLQYLFDRLMTLPTRLLHFIVTTLISLFYFAIRNHMSWVVSNQESFRGILTGILRFLADPAYGRGAWFGILGGGGAQVNSAVTSFFQSAWQTPADMQRWLEVLAPILSLGMLTYRDNPPSGWFQYGDFLNTPIEWTNSNVSDLTWPQLTDRGLTNNEGVVNQFSRATTANMLQMSQQAISMSNRSLNETIIPFIQQFISHDYTDLLTQYAPAFASVAIRLFGEYLLEMFGASLSDLVGWIRRRGGATTARNPDDITRDTQNHLIIRVIIDLSTIALISRAHPSVVFMASFQGPNYLMYLWTRLSISILRLLGSTGIAMFAASGMWSGTCAIGRGVLLSAQEVGSVASSMSGMARGAIDDDDTIISDEDDEQYQESEYYSDDDTLPDIMESDDE